jgi:hypothetical protein
VGTVISYIASYSDRGRAALAQGAPLVVLRSRHTAVAGVTRPAAGLNDMVAATMHPEQHERGNHVV